MSFYLKGIFTTSTDKNIILKAQQYWTDIRSKIINDNSNGICIIGPDPNRSETDEQYQKCQKINYKIEDELPDFSKQFSDTKFVFVFVDCWGGYCQYSGYVCQNGQKIVDLSEQLGETVKQGEQDKNLKFLMTEAGIKFGDNGYFEPFTRNYFD